MKIPTSTLAIRAPTGFNPAAPQLRTFLLHRHYATQTSLGTTPQGPKRKKVTAFNDDGHVPWSELSAGEKASRATQQSFNFSLIIGGIVLTSGVAYYLWTDVFSPDSKTVHFNRTVDRIKSDDRCIELLGDAKHISAHGDETFNKWRRSRPIASTTTTDAKGNEHFQMYFYVEGPRNRGQVTLHLIKPKGHGDFEYKYMYLDVRGHPRIYLENADTDPNNPNRSKMKFLGINWG